MLVAAGIGVYLGYSPGLVVEQILEAEASGSLGVTHFALGQMRGAHFAALKQGLYSRPAVPPYKTVEALHALGAALHESLEMTDGPHELRAVADALTGYTGRDEAELARVTAEIDRALSSAASQIQAGTAWQVRLLREARQVAAAGLNRMQSRPAGEPVKPRPRPERPPLLTPA